MAKDDYNHVVEKMDKTVKVLKEELLGIRAGRANPGILDKLMVDYYGVPTPINQIASVSVPEARVILITPWESKMIGDLEKAIQKSDIGIHPNNDGKSIRLGFPPLTEERRKDLTKQVRKTSEDAKVAIRSIRRDAMETFKAKKKSSEITEDDLKVVEKDIQNLTDKYIGQIEKLMEAKEGEILEV
jgi:ribosome recycling factor